MTSQIDSACDFEICTRVKHLGYSASHHIRIYGEEFEVMSDPFPHNGGIAIHVKNRRDSGIRVLQLPAPLLRTANEYRPARAA